MISKVRDLNPQEAKKIKKSLQKFFYSAGTNIALYNASRYTPSIEFKSKLKRAIEKQINHIATLEHIGRIRTALGKQDRNIVIIVGLLWLAFEKSLQGGDKTVLKFLTWAGNQGGQAALDKILPDKTFELHNLALKDAFQERTSFLLSVLDRTGIKSIANTIENGIENNLTDTEIVRLLRQNAARIADERSDLIDEAELMYAMNLVEVATYKRNGIERVKWVTSNDEKVEETCLANEAEGYIKLGKEFASGQVSPPAHGRCRCYLLPELPDMIDNPIWTGK